MSQAYIDVVSGEEKLPYTAAELLKRKLKIKRKKKFSLGLYQSRQRRTRLAKSLRRRVYEKKSSDYVLSFNDSSTSAFSESITEGYSNPNTSIGSFSLPDLNENAIASEDNAECDPFDEYSADAFVKSTYNDLVNTNLLKRFLLMLDSHNCAYDFICFVRLIVDEKLSVMNLPFLLLLDLVRFLSCKTTTQMKYRIQTRQFWEAVYKFGGGTMIRLFSGLKNFGHVCMKKCKKSLYDPLLADVNFAVPDVKRLAETVGGMKDKVQCGIIEESFDLIDKSKQYNLSVDGKKISPGCTDDEGDIYLFGLEGPPTLEEQRKRLTSEIGFVQNVIDCEQSEESSLNCTVENLEKMVLICSKRIKDQRTTTVNQELLKLTFQKAMQKDPSTLNKFAHAISSIDTCQIFSNDIIQKMLRENRNICEIMAQMRSNYQNFVDGTHVDLQKQNNCCTLIPPENVVLPDDEELLPEYTKQGSEQWLQLRKEAVMTSSTAYAALGMDTLKRQKELFSHRVLGHPEPEITPELQRKFDHGRRNEIHAFGTIAGLVLPAFFNRTKILSQVGSFFLDGDYRQRLVVVSPDGYISNHGSKSRNEDLSVEIKSPMGEKSFVLAVHYSIPGIYVPQVLLQMKVLDVRRALYASISKQSIVILIITFSEELWRNIWALTKRTYDKVSLKKLIRCSKSSSQLKKEISEFVTSNCKFLCELPACTASEGSYDNLKSRIPIRQGKSTRVVVSIEAEMKEKLIQVCMNICDLIKRGYEMERRKATEAVMLVLNDTDRIFDPDSFYAVPVAYFLKGYSLDVAKMRKILDIVLNRLAEESIDVVSTSFDGQWHNIAVKDKNNYPLTKLQLQKYVWNKLGRITKDNLIRLLDNWTKVDCEDLDDCSNSTFFTVGKAAFGNLCVEFKTKGNNKRVLYCNGMNGDSTIDAVLTKIHTPTPEERPDLWNDYASSSVTMKSKSDADIMQISKDANVVTLLPDEFLQSNNMQSVMQDIVDTGDPNHLPDIPANDEAIANSDEISHALLNVNRAFLEQILVGLCAERRSDIWNTYCVEDLYSEIFRNQKSIEKLTSYEMDVINNVFFGFAEKYLFRNKDLKDHKVKVICKLFGRKRKLHRDAKMNTKKVTLRKLALEIIKDIDYPTNVLAVALANTIHIEEKKKWFSKASVPMYIKIPPGGIMHEAFSYPEYSAEREKVECKLLDPTHILTNIRNHICTKGYDKVKRESFLRVSEVNNDVLNRAYIVNVVDKQSAPIAMKFFSSEVQHILMDNNDFEEADFVGLVRKWYEAVDERGIPVQTRLDNMQNFFQYLTDMVKFDVYPPPTKYICGIPIVTFEEILQCISTRFQLYGICRNNTYNQRSLSTLDIETLYSVLSRMEGSFNGCPKATLLSTMLRRLMQMLELQLNPSKIFSVHLSNKKKYPEYNLLSGQDETSTSKGDETMESNTQDGHPVVNLHYRTHAFDKRIKRTRKRNQKNVQIATGNKQLRRECGVRVNYKAYESKIKCTTRHGLRN